MADEHPEESEGSEDPENIEEMRFVGMGDVLAVHADAFFILQNGDNFTVYFFQHDVPDLSRRIKKTEAMQTKRTKCFARISVSPIGFLNLARALTQHAIQAGLVGVATDQPVEAAQHPQESKVE